MALITLESVWKAYGDNSILENVSWQIEPGNRIGLVGRNGCGKTTLFLLLANRLAPDRGAVHRLRSLNIGYLSQDPNLDASATVLETAREGFRRLLDIQSRLRDLEAGMASGKADPATLDEYGRLHDRFEREGGYAIEARAQAILQGLGFQDEDLDLPVTVLSGGQKNRLALARLLAGQPDLLLLDEPTNHLDLQAVEWLENFLADDSKINAFVLISHDRYFLDRTVDEVVELERCALSRYAGNYSFYAAEKERRQEQQQKAYESQQAHIARTEDYIRRNIAGQKTKQAQSRRKALEKLERFDRPSHHKNMALRFSSGARGGDRVLQAESISKTYDNRVLFRNFDLILWKNDRLGIVGPNGCGKSTLIKTLVNRISPDKGRITHGRDIQVGYYEQTRQDLNPERTILDEVWSITPEAPVGEIRTFLGAFLFSGDEVERKIGSLSGGEQSRVALAKLVRMPVNLLVLDEPTNHLDIPSRIILEHALDGFDGTLIAVSHDRYFLNRIVDRLLVFEPGGLKIIEGNYDVFRQQRDDAPQETVQESPDKIARKAAYEETRRLQRDQERRKRRTAELEREIANIEKEIERLNGEMAREDLASDWDRLQDMARQRAQRQSQIDALFEEWEALEAESERTE